MKSCPIKISLYFLVTLASLLAFIDQVRPETNSEEGALHQEVWFMMTSPAEGVVINKTPEIKVQFLKSISVETLLVVLDETDITQIITLTRDGFEYIPQTALPPGTHTLIVIALNASGLTVQKDFSFTTRHSRTFEETSIESNLTASYEQIVHEEDKSRDFPERRFEGNEALEMKLKDKHLTFTFQTNMRELQQNAFPQPPQKRGISIANWLMTGLYEKDNLRFKTSVGDVSINETPYTVSSLARKGGVFNSSYESIYLNAFSVQSEQFFGIKHGIGIGGDDDSHIIGFSGGVRPLDERIEFRTIYVYGGEPGSSFGVSLPAGKSKGDAVGFLLNTDLLNNKLMTEFELDFSSFDPDTSDEFDRKHDSAYRFQAGGLIDIYNYEIKYERIGTDYQVVGNQGLQNDREGFGFTGSTFFDVHAMNLGFSRYIDNLKDNPLFHKTINYQGNAGYSYYGIQKLPLSVNYTKSIQNSTREPADSFPIELHSDTVGGSVTYTHENLNVSAQTIYSYLNDRTQFDYDTTTTTYAVTSSYATQYLFLAPAFSLNQSKNKNTEVRLDTYVISLNTRTNLFRDLLSIDSANTYSITKADDDSVDNSRLNINVGLTYSLKKLFRDYLTPSISLRGEYNTLNDKVVGEDSSELNVFLVVAASGVQSF